MKRYRKKVKIAMTMALAISAISNSMGAIAAKEENYTQEESVQKVEENNEQKESKSGERITGDVVINSTNFPDPFFRQYIKDFYRKAEGDILSESDRNRLTQIDLNATKENPGTDIRSLEGIEYFPALTYLGCRYQSELTGDLDLRQFQSLKSVGMTATKITDINIEGLTTLIYIDIAETLVPESELDFSQNKSIEHIDISDTRITKLNIDGITTLTWLDYGNSGIKEEIDASNNPGLKVLSLGGINSKGHINIDYPLTELHCHRAEIYSLDLSNKTELTYLECRYNNLTWLDVGNNPNLVTLNKSDSLIDLGELGSSFNITNVTEAFEGIDPARVTVVSGANYNPTTGEVSGYQNGTPIKYTYDAGTMANGVPVILNVTLTFTTRIPTTITLQYSDKQYTGNPVPLPTNNEYTTTGGSTGNVTFKWYAADDTTTEISAPINVGSYKVKAFLSATNTHGAAESDFVDFRITPAPSSITINNYAGKIYDGQAVVDPTDITRTQNNANVTFEYYHQDDLTTPIAAPREVGRYAVKAFLRGDTNYVDSESNTVLFEITKIASNITVDYEDKVYDGNEVIDPIKYTIEGGSTGEVSFQWYEKNEDTAGNVTWKVLTTKPVNVGVYGVKAVLAETDTHERAESGIVEFRVTPAPSTIEIKDHLNKVYDGESVEDPTDIEKTGSSGAVTYEWYEKEVARNGEEIWTLLDKAPQDAGDYKVKAYLEADQNYLGAEREKEFTIEKAPSKVAIEEELDKDYDGVEVKVPQISIEGSSGIVTFTWYQKDTNGEGWIKLESVPKEAGKYKVEVTLEEDRNYLSAKTEKEFTIREVEVTVGLQTGDNTQRGLWAIIMGLSMSVLYFFRRKEKYTK